MKRLNMPDAVERYLAGESIEDIAKSYGVSRCPVVSRLREFGCMRTVKDAQRLRFKTKPVDEPSTVSRYAAGESEKALAESFGVSRLVIRKVLLANGVSPRGRSDAMYMRMSQTSEAGRLELTEAAHAAVRGVPQSEKHREKTAMTRERNVVQASPIETKLASRLADRGVIVVQQKAVGRYNVDIAIEESSVAVEVFGGHWHASGRHGSVHRERTDYLIDRGWLPIIIWVTGGFPLSGKAVDYVVACHEAARFEKAVRREEHVIRGDGEGGPVSKGYPAGVPVVPCYKAALDARRDDSRPRQ